MIAGLIRVRNESLILKATLDHMATFCSEIFVYDDYSTDGTVSLCMQHKKVGMNNMIVEMGRWNTDRYTAETEQRKRLMTIAESRTNANWLVYMDADEVIEFDFSKLNYADFDCVRMKLFDFYMTEGDCEEYKSGPLKNLRTWMGPEYREINMCWRKGMGEYSVPNQRAPIVNGRILHDGYVRHYGKSLSMTEWERKCEYYEKYYPMYSKKWTERKGKSIHTLSDFGRPLIEWEDRHNTNKIVKI